MLKAYISAEPFSFSIYIHLAYVVADVFETKFNLDFRQVSYSISLAASLGL